MTNDKNMTDALCEAAQLRASRWDEDPVDLPDNDKRSPGELARTSGTRGVRINTRHVGGLR